MQTYQSNHQWIAVILTFTLALLGCGGNEKDTETSPSEDEQGSIAGGIGGTPGTGSLQLALLAPSVKAATPAGLLTPKLSLTDLSSTEFKTRFFSAGPTDVLDILSDIDERIAGINTRSVQNNPACLTLAPVAYTLDIFDETIAFYGQCFESMSSSNPADPSLIQFAVKDDVTYLYYAVGQQRVAAIATPIAAQPGEYSVNVWLGVGYLNADGCGTSGTFDGCSYGAIRIAADSVSSSFEMAVAGIGFGYCGAQMKSDGLTLYAEGSVDGESCEEPASLCVDASQLDVAADCSTLSPFALAALGRDVASGDREHTASLYPVVPNIILTGLDDDSIHFGPTTPTAGLGDFAN